MKYRVATHDDIETVAKIHDVATHAGYSKFLPAGLLDNVTLENRLPKWRDRFDNEHVIIIASDDSIDIGFAYIIDSPEFASRKQDAPELSHLFVIPEFWNRGVGRALCEQAATHVITQGADRIRMWTFETNIQARRAYESWGFVLDGASRKYNYEGTEFPQVRYHKIFNGKRG